MRELEFACPAAPASRTDPALSTTLRRIPEDWDRRENTRQSPVFTLSCKSVNYDLFLYKVKTFTL